MGNDTFFSSPSHSSPSPLTNSQTKFVFVSSTSGRVLKTILSDAVTLTAEGFEAAMEEHSIILNVEDSGLVLNFPNPINAYALSVEGFVTRFEEATLCARCFHEEGRKCILNIHADAYPGSTVNSDGSPSFLCGRCARINVERICKSRSFWSLFSLRRYVIY